MCWLDSLYKVCIACKSFFPAEFTLFFFLTVCGCCMRYYYQLPLYSVHVFIYSFSFEQTYTSSRLIIFAIFVNLKTQQSAKHISELEYKITVSASVAYSMNFQIVICRNTSVVCCHAKNKK